MDLVDLHHSNFGRHQISTGQFIRSNEFPGEKGDIIYHKNLPTLNCYYELYSVLNYLPESVFEIGVSEGGSLVLWSELFNCTVAGVDHDIWNLSHEFIGYATSHDVTVIHADLHQLDIIESSLSRLFGDSGPIDLIIDDGTHTIEPISFNFKSHYGKLSNRGLYVIEDWYALHPIHREELLLFLIETTKEMGENSIIRKFPSMIVINKTVNERIT